jgi:hypothetical protein
MLLVPEKRFFKYFERNLLMSDSKSTPQAG